MGLHDQLKFDIRKVDCSDPDSFLLIRVGSETRPAEVEDISDVVRCMGEIKKAYEEDGKKFPVCFVTHHVVDISKHLVTELPDTEEEYWQEKE